MKKLLRFLKDNSGTTAIEYALIASLIAVAIVFAVTSLGNEVANFYNNILTALQAASS